jgi:flagellum-specific peptidoglycan hydrolase FlgJ
MAVIAQMGLERGWKVPEDNNYGNITTGEAWSGKSNERGDHDAKGNPIKQNFRSYDSTNHFVNDYVSLLKKQYPTSYKELFSSNFDIDRFTSGLVDEKFQYAQNPKYKELVKGVYNDVAANISRNKQ